MTEPIEYFTADPHISKIISDRSERYGGENQLRKYFFVPIVIRLVDEDSARINAGDKSYDTKEELRASITKWDVGDFAVENLTNAIWSCRDELAVLFLIDAGDCEAHVATYKNGTMSELVYSVSVNNFSDME